MWIECGLLNYKLIIPMMYPIFHQLRIFIHKNDEKFFLDLFTNYLGFLLGGLVYLFIQWRMKKKASIPYDDTNDNNTETVIIELNDALMPDLEESNEISVSYFKKVKTKKIKKENEKKIDLNKAKEEKKKSIKKHLYILALAIIYLIPMILNVFNTYSFRIGSSVSLLFTIIFYVIFGRLILGMKIYSHQIFSLIIILVSIITIILLTFIGKKIDNVFISLLYIFAIVVLFCLYNNLVKKYFNIIYMASPYYFMFIIGLISICIIFPYEIITVIAFGKDTAFNGIFYQMEKNFEKTKLYPLIFIADIIIAFLIVGGIILTIYFFTPYHIIISESISQILSAFIIYNFGDLPMIKRVFIYILLFIIFLGSLIYNEIFIINICSLNKNTQKYIIKRQKEETDDINDDI